MVASGDDDESEANTSLGINGESPTRAGGASVGRAGNGGTAMGSGVGAGLGKSYGMESNGGRMTTATNQASGGGGIDNDKIRVWQT